MELANRGARRYIWGVKERDDTTGKFVSTKEEGDRLIDSPIGVRLRRRYLVELDRLAAESGLKRSEYIRRAVEDAIGLGVVYDPEHS
jgi:Ribbon-helix-helix protein, copG family